MVKQLSNEEFPSIDIVQTVRWNHIWKWHGPPRVRSFLWLANHRRLLTKHHRFSHHLYLDPICSKCQLTSETTLHVLQDFLSARSVWLKIIPPVLCHTFSLRICRIEYCTISNNKSPKLKVSAGVCCLVSWLGLYGRSATQL